MSREKWTELQVEWLTALFPTRPTREVAKHLGMSEPRVSNKASQLGLKKCSVYLAEQSTQFRKGRSVSPGTQFVKGAEPWNKGINFISGGRSAVTQFKKGGKPHTWVPIGTEVMREGYLCRKVRDGKPTHKNYEMVHKLMWCEAHGELPDRHIVIFKDGNRTNLALENLMAISRSDNMRRNTIHNYPEEIKGAIRLVTKLKKRIRANEKQD